jgi:hypothetical protein
LGKKIGKFYISKNLGKKKTTTTTPPASYFLVVTRRALRLSDHLEALTLGPHMIFRRQVDGVTDLYFIYS